jgi:hypothetical protein
MLAILALALFFAGLLLGRLYSFAALALISPLAWLVAWKSAVSDHQSSVIAILYGIAILFVLQAGYLVGARMRAKLIARSYERTAQKNAAKASETLMRTEK